MADLHLYLHTPAVVFKARVNLASPVYPLETIPFDGVTVGAYTDVTADMFMVIGSADALDDRGRTRVQNVLTSTNIPVGRISQGTHDGELDLSDNDFITIYDDYRVHSKIPYIDATGVQYKDSTVPVGDYTGTDIPPVANMGAGFADFINSGTSLITVTFVGTNSFAVADGATISTYSWDVGDGTITVGTSASSTITATFPAGFRWVALTVTDSNGTPFTTRRPVLAVNPAADPSLPYGSFVIERHTHNKSEGQQLDIRFVEDIPTTTYKDGMLALLWDGAPSGPSDRSHMQAIVWHQSDQANVRATRTATLKDTVLRFVDVCGRMKTLPGFSQYLEKDATPNNWDQMVNPSMRKYIHYLLLWHGTALGVADLFLPEYLEDDYPFVLFDSDGESLYAQIENEARRIVPQHGLYCNGLGQLTVRVDPMLQDPADRTIVTQGTFTEDFTESIEFEVTRPPRAHWLRGHAILAGTDYTIVDGSISTLLTVHCIAPGTAPGQGVSEVETNEGLARTQVALNSAKGHEYERMNSRFGRVRVTPPDESTYALVDPANEGWVNLTVTAATAAQRGYTFTNQRTQCHQINFTYEHSRTGVVRRSEFELEIETVGRPALTVLPEGAPDAVITVPPSFGLITGQQLVAGVGNDGYIYRTSDFQTVSGSGGPTWTRVDTTIADTIYSFVVDPFSPGYINGTGTGTINGWIVNDTAIYRVADLFGSATATSVFTFPTATVAASFHWRTIQASFGAFFGGGLNPWLVCASYYGDTTGHTGTWVTRSVDGGATWSAEVQVSADFDADTPTRFNPIGVFTSPRTPGKAYTAAHVNVAGGPLPLWGWWSGNVLTELGTSASASLEISAAATGEGPIVTVTKSLLVAPPEDAVRIEVDVVWSAVHTRSGGAASGSSSMNLLEPINVTQTGTDDYDSPEPNTSTSGSFSITYTLASGTNWPISRESVEAGHPASASGTRTQVTCVADASGAGNTDETVVNITMTVTEIELDGSVIYSPTVAEGAGFVSTNWGAAWAETALIAPGQGQAGSIHIPWEDNASEGLIYFGHFDKATNHVFRLKKSVGGVITDISPIATSIPYGVNHYGFAIRAYDSDRQKLALGGIGNSTSAAPADDKVGLWVSSNAGTAWTNILAPVAASNVKHGLQIAFAGDSSSVLFAWGGWSNAASLAAIYYSGDGGTTLDSREGNMNSLGTVALLGIAGGPTG